MDESKFNNSVSAELPAGQLRKVYDRLADEATPHAVRVRKGDTGKQITIYCDDKDVAYFKAIIWAT